MGETPSETPQSKGTSIHLTVQPLWQKNFVTYSAQHSRQT